MPYLSHRKRLVADKWMFPTLRSFSKDNDKVDDILFTLYNADALSCNWMGMNGSNERFIVICSRCRQHLKFGDFTLLFCGLRQRNAREKQVHGVHVHVQHVYFSFLTNHIRALWRCCCRSRCLCLIINFLSF